MLATPPLLAQPQTALISSLNPEIDEFARLVSVGTPIEIKP